MTFQPSSDGVAVNANARYLALELSTDETQQWDIAGFDIEYIPRGNF